MLSKGKPAKPWRRNIVLSQGHVNLIIGATRSSKAVTLLEEVKNKTAETRREKQKLQTTRASEECETSIPSWFFYRLPWLPRVIFWYLFSNTILYVSFRTSFHFLKSKWPPGASQLTQMVKTPPSGVLGSIPGSGRSPGEGNSNPLQYSCLENPMDRGACPLVGYIHGVTKSQTWLSN